VVRRLVFTAGASPLYENGEVVSPGYLDAQTVRTIEVNDLLAALTEHAATPSGYRLRAGDGR
jgi:hypothetical protein